jgi:uncharacterized protein (DUF3084 family)
MFNDSELRRIEDTLKRNRDEMTKLGLEEREIHERARKAVQRIHADEERDIERLTRRHRDLERDIQRLENDRDQRQEELQSDFNKGVKH